MNSAKSVTRSARSGLLALAAGLGMAGCGGSHAASSSTRGTPSAPTTSADASTAAAAKTPTTTTPSATERVPDIDIPVKTFAPVEPLPARYTCDGANVPPPLRWGRVPRGTAEIDIFVTNLTSTGESTEWAVAGLKPNLRSLPSGHLPRGAIVGRNSLGEARYSVCPPKGAPASFFVLVIPLPHKIAVRPGFEGQALSARAVRIARHEGQMSFEYARR